MQLVNEPLNKQLLDKLQSKVTYLNCSDPALTENDYVHIQRELDKNRTLTSLSFESSNIDIAKLKILMGCTTLQTLDLSNNNLGVPGAEILSSQSHLRSLILWNTNITTQGAMIIARNNSTLTDLDVSANNIDNTGFTAIIQIPTLKKLRFANNVPNILSSFPANSTLRWLDLSHNVVTPQALRSLLLFSSLTSLVFNNNIGADHPSLFLLASSLSSLTLDTNDFGPQGAEELSLSPSLISLRLSSNEIGSIGAKALSKNTTLTYLDVSPYHQIDEDVQKELNRSLCRNRKARDERKKEFIWKMIVLARDAKNSDSQSSWHNLPSDVRFSILLHLNLSGSSWIGFSKDTVQNFTRFIFDNIAIYNSYLQKPISNTGKIFLGKSALTKYPFKFFRESDIVVVEQKEEQDSSEASVPSFNS